MLRLNKSKNLIVLLLLASTLITLVSCVGSGVSTETSATADEGTTGGTTPGPDYTAALPDATIAFSSTSLAELQALGTATGATGLSGAGTSSMTVEFSSSVDNFRLLDITVVGGTASNFSGSGTSYTFDVTWSANKGSISIVRANSSSMKLVSFTDDIAPIFNTPLQSADGTSTNNSACIYCHSSGTQAERQALKPTLCFGSSSGNLAACSTTTFPKGSFFMDGSLSTPTVSTWTTAIPTITHAGLTAGKTGATTIDTTGFDPASSSVYTKLGAAGNMPQNSTTAIPVTENYRHNPNRASATQLKLVSDWITQGAKNN